MNRSEAGKLGAEAARETQVKHKADRRAQYALSPSYCSECLVPLSFEKRGDKFCSRSCAVTQHNRVSPKRMRTRPMCPCGKLPTAQNKWCETCITTGVSRNRITSPEQARTAGALRRYLLRTRGHICQSCFRTAWEGAPIPLETEHVDGNSENNGEENLKLLCPNCHALTPTFKAKNKGHGRFARRERYAAGKSY